MDAYTGLNATGTGWAGPLTPTINYRERVKYDANGNILNYDRRGNANLSMDSLKYAYAYTTLTAPNTLVPFDPSITNPYTIAGLKEVRNQLTHVADLTPATNYTTDIDNQPISNYEYDEIGNLIKDSSENRTLITWNVYGKIERVEKLTNVATKAKYIQYTYDASGNRISKRIATYGTAVVDYTQYVRDASGNVMAVYSYVQDSTTTATALTAGTLNLTEQHLYGSSRIAVLNRVINVEANTNEILIFTRGNKFFEFNNNLK